jgi:hypothetical protein
MTRYLPCLDYTLKQYKSKRLQVFGMWMPRDKYCVSKQRLKMSGKGNYCGNFSDKTAHFMGLLKLQPFG